MLHVRDEMLRSHRSQWDRWSHRQHTGRLQPDARLIQRVAAPSAFAGEANKTNDWDRNVMPPWPHVRKRPSDPRSLPTLVSGDERAPHYHWHQDTHHHHYYAAAEAPGLGQLDLSALPALPPGEPALSRSGGCLVTFLILLGAFLTFMVLLMGLALAGQILALH